MELVIGVTEVAVGVVEAVVRVIGAAKIEALIRRVEGPRNQRSSNRAIFLV